MNCNDRIGIGWRPELAVGILENLHRIDVVEVIADDYFDAPGQKVRALKTLAAQVPVVLHGVSLGAASTVPVEPRRLERMARLVDHVQPGFWSEHLAFVRGGGLEIGHLAAPPRNSATVEGCAANLVLAQAAVGSMPLMENIATLMEPPGSDRDEAEWLSDVLQTSGCNLLLDLHNVHANALNFGFDACDFIRRLPGERIAAIHLAGGRWISAPAGDVHEGERRLLDDHLHDVPDPVYELLELVGERVSRPLTVILERDGDYPPIEHLLSQIERARRTLLRGRQRALQPATVEAA